MFFIDFHPILQFFLTPNNIPNTHTPRAVTPTRLQPELFVATCSLVEDYYSTFFPVVS